MPAGRELTAALHAFARRERITLFMLLLAAFYVLLNRHSGQPDLVVGTPVSGRDHPDLEGLIGLFVNTLALRCEVGDGPEVRTLLRRVREQTLEDFAHQQLPFELLVEELKPLRDLGRSPVYQVLLNHLNQPRPPLALPDLRITAVPL